MWLLQQTPQHQVHQRRAQVLKASVRILWSCLLQKCLFGSQTPFSRVQDTTGGKAWDYSVALVGPQNLICCVSHSSELADQCWTLGVHRDVYQYAVYQTVWLLLLPKEEAYVLATVNLLVCLSENSLCQKVGTGTILCIKKVCVKHTVQYVWNIRYRTQKSILCTTNQPKAQSVQLSLVVLQHCFF